MGADGACNELQIIIWMPAIVEEEEEEEDDDEDEAAVGLLLLLAEAGEATKSGW